MPEPQQQQQQQEPAQQGQQQPDHQPEAAQAGPSNARLAGRRGGSVPRHHLEPLGVFLVRKGGTGDRILFRYPYGAPPVKRQDDDKADPDRNHFAIQELPESIALYSQGPKVR